MAKAKKKPASAAAALKNHFGRMALHDLVTSTRVFPATTRLDVVAALTEVFEGFSDPLKLYGFHADAGFSTITFAELTAQQDRPVTIAPLQYDEIDTGATMPSRCLVRGIWLGKQGRLRFALLMCRVIQYGQKQGVHLELAVPPGEDGVALSRRLFDDVDKKISKAASYRGKVLSLELSDNYRGGVEGIKVHRLRTVERDHVILPDKTLRLLESNVSRFIEQRQKLNGLGLGIKKGLLFYGPPGTGKTLTIHYLASQLRGHTTLLITADQVALLDEYMQLARFLQPAMVVMEDVDLIARARTSMRNPCEESLLNRLLNEMDGLREDAQVLFVLTTNRPEHLEEALTSRPGRIDQAIEFPLPDEEGRRRLINLYAGQLQMTEEVCSVLVRKTKGGSGAFIKELMRRSAQFLLEAGGKGLSEQHIEAALDEMLFSGGSLNAKLLGIFPRD